MPFRRSYCNRIGTWHLGTIASFRELRRIYRMLVFMLLLHAHPCSAVFYIFSLLFRNYDWRSFRQFFDRFILSNLDFMPALKFSLIFSNDVLIVMFKNKNILFRENSIYIGSAFFAGLTGVPDRHAQRPRYATTSVAVARISLYACDAV